MSVRLCVLTCMPLDARARAMKIQMHKRLKRICSPSNSRPRKKNRCAWQLFASNCDRMWPNWIVLKRACSHASLDGCLNDSDAWRHAGATENQVWCLFAGGCFKLTVRVFFFIAGIFQGKLATSVFIMSLISGLHLCGIINNRPHRLTATAGESSSQVGGGGWGDDAGCFALLLLENWWADVCQGPTEETQVVAWFLSNDWPPGRFGGIRGLWWIHLSQCSAPGMRCDCLCPRPNCLAQLWSALLKPWLS